jgi:hypothetical protein
VPALLGAPFLGAAAAGAVELAPVPALAAPSGAPFAAPGGAVPTGTRITRGPYLQLASPTGVTMLWRSDGPVGAATVDVRPTGNAGAPWTTVTSGSRGTEHAIALDGLQPRAEYEYRVRFDDRVAYEGGAFRTLPTPQSTDLDFDYYSDTQTGHQPHAEVVRRILRESQPPALLIHGGDQCENGSRPEQWDQWFEIERDLLSRVAVFPALGNHEENSPLYFEHFRFPSNGTGQGQGRWYSFDAGPAHFIALDVVYSDVEPGSPQYRWLEQDLTRTDRKWKFAYFHYPPYNASPHHGSNLRLRESLEPLFLRYRVSAVFNGHGHLYERAFGERAAVGAPPLLWFVAGGGGAVPQPPGREAFTQYTEVTFHFLRVTLRDDRMSTAGVKPDGTEFDRFEGRLASDGRVVPVTESPVVAGAQLPRTTALDFVASPRAGLLAAYQAALSIAAPLGLSVALPGRRRPVVPVPSGPVHRPRERPEDPHAGWRGLPVLGLAAGTVLLLLLALLPTAPLRWLVGYDAYTVALTVHALLGTLMLLAASSAAVMGYRLASHHAPALPWIHGAVWATAALALLALALGDALFAQYVKSGGPMEAVVRKAADAHAILFEFKARMGLLPLPLAGAAAYVTWRYKEDLRRDRHLAELVALLLLLLVFFVLTPYGLGAAVTRLRGLL